MKNYDADRIYLKENGWDRRDRTFNGVNTELWQHQDSHGLISFESALRRQKAWDKKKTEQDADNVLENDKGTIASVSLNWESLRVASQEAPKHK